MVPTLVLPREHGAWLTLMAATVAGLLLAMEPAPAIGASLVLAAAVVLRASADRVAMGRGLRLREWLGAGVVAGIGIGALSLSPGLAAAVLGVLIIAASAWASRGRRRRALALELVAMTALGGSAGVISFAGRAPLLDAVALAVVLGVHAGASVPMVRVRLRAAAREHTSSWALQVGAALVLAAACLAVLGRPAAALALVPRSLSLAAIRSTSWGTRPASRLRVGIEETIFLGMTIAIAAWALR